MAANARLARRRPQQGGQDTHRRRLARAIGADEAEHRPFLDGQIQAIDGQQIAVAFRQVAQFDDGRHCVSRTGISKKSSVAPCCSAGAPAVVGPTGLPDSQPPSVTNSAGSGTAAGLAISPV